MSDGSKTQAVVVEVEASHKVDAEITKLCNDPKIPAPQRRLLNEALNSLKNINSNLIEALPSNRRVACLRLQRAGKLRKRDFNIPADFVQSQKKLKFLPMSPSVTTQVRGIRMRKARQKTLTQRTSQELINIRRSHESLYREEVRKVMNIKNKSGGIWPASPRLIGRILLKVPISSIYRG